MLFLETMCVKLIFCGMPHHFGDIRSTQRGISSSSSSSDAGDAGDDDGDDGGAESRWPVGDLAYSPRLLRWRPGVTEYSDCATTTTHRRPGSRFSIRARLRKRKIGQGHDLDMKRSRSRP